MGRWTDRLMLLDAVVTLLTILAVDIAVLGFMLITNFDKLPQTAKRRVIYVDM